MKQIPGIRKELVVYIYIDSVILFMIINFTCFISHKCRFTEMLIKENVLLLLKGRQLYYGVFMSCCFSRLFSTIAMRVSTKVSMSKLARIVQKLSKHHTDQGMV